MSRAALSFAFAALSVGCNVPLAALEQATVNTCAAASDCGGAAACEGGKCVATSYDLGGLLLAVRPQADASFAVDMSYVVDLTAAHVALVSPGASGAPFDAGFDVQLPSPVSIQSGKVVVDPSISLPATCTLVGRSVPATLTFFRDPSFAGLPSESVVANAVAPDSTQPFAFDLALVADVYDIYIEPGQVVGCPTFPPYFLSSQTITAPTTGAAASALTWTLPPAGTLTGTITGLTDLSQWEVDVLEWTRGQIISAGTTLTPAPTGATVTAYVNWPDPSAPPPILRLRPVATPVDGVSTQVALARPTVFWTLQGAIFGGTDADPQVNFTVEDLAVDPAQVTGQIVGATYTVGVMSQLILQSQTLQGSNAGNASFATTAVTDPEGNFSVDLPPGTYWVRAIPLSDDTRSITDFTLQSPAGPSVSLQLQPRGTLVGTITTALGTSLGSTPVNATPSQQLPRSYLADTHTLGPVATRTASTTTDVLGRFSLALDVGSSDLVVQPDPLTNLPWLVRPQVTVMTASMLVVTAPAFLGGAVLAPDGTPIADAEIDAWYPVRDPTVAGGLTGTVIKIATTSTDQNGLYTLVLPSTIGPAGASL